MNSKRLLKGAAILIICNLIGKILGAVYRIPLARMLGSVGMGMYQLVFPLYCLILTVSTSGMPVAISKLVAEYNSKNQFEKSKKILKISLLILTLISFLGAIVVVLGAKFIAKIQGNFDVFVCYYGIAPAILFVGVLSAFRGYFQGNILMFPTAISSLIEQFVKIVFGLFLAGRFFEFGIEYAVLGALIGVSISELFAFLFLLVCYLFLKKQKIAKNEHKKEEFKVLTKQIFSLAVPVTLGGLIAPITAMIDSLLVVNLLMISGFSSEMATTLLGLQSGVVEPLLNLPVIIGVSISTVLLPNISALATQKSVDEINDFIEKAFQISLCISIACAICYVIFGSQVLNFLYGSSFDNNELLISTKLLFAGSLNIIFLSLVQVTAGVLQGLNHSKVPVKSLLIGCGIKIVLDCVLIPISAINIFGVMISGAVCYFVVFSLNFSKIKKLTGLDIKNTIFYTSIQASLVCLFAYVVNVLCKMVFSDVISMFVSGFVAVAVFFVTYYMFFIYGGQNKEFNKTPIK